MSPSLKSPIRDDVDLRQILILSGGSGRTATQVVQSALAQFDSSQAEITIRPELQTELAVLNAIKRAEQNRAIICHTFVDPKIREVVTRECQLRDLPVVDLMGHTVQLFADQLGQSPRNQPGLSYELNREQFDRIEAVDFTIAHDDGARAHELRKADIVLVGVSRVSKSVTCFYLACRGIRAANVPLVEGIDPPQALLKLPPEKVIGLTMNPQRLQCLRQARSGAIRAANLSNYAEIASVGRELREANHLMQIHGWRTIDVSYKAVEEVASEIIQMNFHHDEAAAAV